MTSPAEPGTAPSSPACGEASEDGEFLAVGAPLLLPLHRPV